MGEAVERRGGWSSAYQCRHRPRLQRHQHSHPLARGTIQGVFVSRLDDLQAGAGTWGYRASRRKRHARRFHQELTVKKEDEERQIAMLRAYTVFNIGQIDGLEVEAPVVPDVPPHEATEAFISATKADIRHGGGRACFIPSQYFIALRPKSSFINVESYYATSLHELGHWSGHKTRLDRDLSGRFGGEAYAAEELVAELNAAFLCAHLGIPGELRHSEYLGHWLTLLKEDSRAIFTASSKASQSANYLRAFSGELPESECPLGNSAPPHTCARGFSYDDREEILLRPY